MITEINIKKVATYGQEGANIKELKKVNFFFGANGSGKTTISRIIANPDNPEYKDSGPLWENDEPMARYVFNTDYVRENFTETENLKGIFTLGKEQADTQVRIKAVENDLSVLEKAAAEKKVSLREVEKERENLTKNLSDELWKAKGIYEGEFSAAFTGLGKKKLTMEKFLEVYNNGSSQAICVIENLRDRAQTVFDKTAEKEALLRELSQTEIDNLLSLNEEKILQKAIIAKQENPLKPLIDKLKNNDWVHQGMQYLHSEGELCPFCQQEITADLLRKLEGLFDEEYQTDIQQLENVRMEYISLSEYVIGLCKEVFSNKTSLFDHAEFSILHERVEVKLKENRSRIETKIRNPSKSISLEPISVLLRDLSAFLIAANKKVKEHNELIGNRKEEEKRLVDDIWNYLVVEYKDSLENYREQTECAAVKTEELKQEISEKQSEIAAKNNELAELRRNIVSVQPTIEVINKLLVQFGFLNFELACCGENSGFYKLVRPDGSDAKETLSEGEKSFVTFLYFYYSIKGSSEAQKDETKADKVIVLDDPVSSLDSSVLFIVSELVRDIIENVRDKRNSEKQIFIFTHNIYFHKQVTNEQEGDIAYYIVRKDNLKSIIISNGNKNPIENSYQILWSELKALKEHKDTASVLMIQNIMRRIIEYYFRFLGGKEPKALTRNLKEANKRIGMSLVVYMHSGSHNIADEICYSPDADIDIYLDVFKEIFESNNQQDHYNMMWQGGNDRLMMRSKK